MKILVVEDNHKFAQLVIKALSGEGHVVEHLADGATAVSTTETVAYDLMILDRMVPGKDGLQVCKTLRQRGSHLPILMVTTRDEASEMVEGLDAGADDYLARPFDLGEFLARVRALGRRARGAQSSVEIFRLGRLYVDVNEHSAQLDGCRLDLTAREFSLLVCLARSAGLAVPRGALLATAWHSSFDPESNVLEVHVGNIRDKLGDDAAMIQTVRGIGYRLIVVSG